MCQRNGPNCGVVFTNLIVHDDRYLLLSWVSWGPEHGFTPYAVFTLAIFRENDS
jgi:hypothetical protein